MTALYTIRDALSTFFSSPLRKWSSVFLLAVLALGGAYYYQIQSLGKVQAAYTIANSARFISGNSDYLNRTFGAGNQKTWTFSTWIKLGKLDTNRGLFGLNSTLDAVLYVDSSNRLDYQTENNPARRLTTTAVLRDPAGL